MAEIRVSGLTFGYEGSADNVFENVSFSVDTNWRLGFVGRNGKGKTTLLQLLMGRYDYRGTISTGTAFDYFPYSYRKEDESLPTCELVDSWKRGVQDWRILCELNELKVDPEVLYRPLGTLSHGERTKVMLAVLFSGDNDFLLIDEPTNHLDQGAREQIKAYLAGKKGFILVSHDRDLLDACIDHVLVLNRKTVEVQKGNFRSWWENKEKKDAFAVSENEKHRKEIKKLKESADRVSRWAEKSEGSKIGFDPAKNPDRPINARAYIGSKTKKMEARVKEYETRIGREIEAKEDLLQDLEQTYDLKIAPLKHYKKTLVYGQKYGLKYQDGGNWLFTGLNLSLEQGEKLFLTGDNGCGKSSLIKQILAHAAGSSAAGMQEEGTLEVAPNLIISYISQDTSFLEGSARDFCRERGLEETMFFTLLRQLDMERAQFEKRIENFSEGQKKKVLIAASLMTPAHLYIWDEPLNYIDVFSRMQIEKLLTRYNPTMILVEHDKRFREQIGGKEIVLCPEKG